MSSADMVPVHPQVLADLQARAADSPAYTYGGRAGQFLYGEGKEHGRMALRSVGIGGVMGFIASLEDLKNSKAIKDHWWLLPVGMMALGYVLGRRKNQLGQANQWGPIILALGAFMFVQAWQSQPKKDEKKETKTDETTKTDTGGVDDGTVWLPTPGGQWVRVTAQQLRQWMPANSTAAVQDAAAHLAAAAFAA
jgi:hypothetical protein